MRVFFCAWEGECKFAKFVWRHQANLMKKSNVNEIGFKHTFDAATKKNPEPTLGIIQPLQPKPNLPIQILRFGLYFYGAHHRTV